MNNKFKSWKSHLQYRYSFLKIFNSPFVTPRFKFYFGEIRHGTPYFLPRKWIKCNLEDANTAWNKLSEASKLAYDKNEGGKNNWLQKYIRSYNKAIDIKHFGFQFISLGWKTKWDDCRFEWSPMLSIVLFGKQLCIWIIPKGDTLSQYWEGWLYYNYRTNPELTVEERLVELFNQYTCTWISYKQGEEKVTTDYFYLILKRKYIPIYNNWKIKNNEQYSNNSQTN